MSITRGLLLDVEFVMRKSQPAIRVVIKTTEGTKRFYDMDFEPYFYVDCTEEQAVKLKDFSIDYNGAKVSIKRIEHETLNYAFKEKKLHKVVVFHPGQVPAFKAVLEKSFECYEYNIVWTKRFIIDKQLIPSKLVEVEAEGVELKTIKHVSGEFTGKLKLASIDIETHNPKGMPVPEKDPSLMISYYDDQKRLFTYEKEFSLENVDSFENEKKMIEEFDSFVKFDNPDILCTYNGDQFDLPYLQTRAKILGTKITLGRDHVPMRTRQAGMRVITTLSGRIHFDVYPVVAFMNFIGAIKIQRLTLENAYKEIMGVQKKMVERLEIWKTWDEGTKEELDLLATYCMGDSEACQALAEYFLPQVLALSAVTGMTFLEVSRGTASQFVEMRLMREAEKRNELFPNTPGQEESKNRMGNPIQGAYVKVPKPGIYENIAVLDFKSLYPSIIISYNIDPFTINCDCCNKENAYVSPTGDHFCKKKKGIIPETLEKILNERIRVQGEMKKLEKDSREYKMMWAEQWSLKILMNSFYGYLVYAKARYYSREAGESVTALARKYIQDTMKKAEDAGFEVLYGDSVTKDRFVTILDSNGFIKIKNIEELFKETSNLTITRGEKEIIFPKGLKALSVNPKTLQPEWNTINEVIRHKVNKKIYRVNQKYGESITTEDHSFMTLSNNKLIEVKPQKMKDNKMFKITSIPKVKQITEIDVYEVLKSYYSKKLYKGKLITSTVKADAENVYFGWSNQTNPVSVKRFIKVESKEFESLCRLLGAYIPEGSSSTIETTSSRFGASIASSDISWLSILRQDYQTLFNRVNNSIIPSSPNIRILTYNNSSQTKTITYQDNTHKLQMMNSLSAVFFKMFCGQKSYGKKLPDFIYHVPEKYQRILLEEMIKGDGSHWVNPKAGYSEEYVKNNFKYTTKSLQLISGLSLLLNQLKITYSIQYRESKKVYTLTTSSNFRDNFKTKIVQESYNDYVYDLNVENSHTFVDSCGQILLHNTDSSMLLYTGHTEDDVENFRVNVNKDLPGRMQLELEDFYPRGIFVSKKQGDTKEEAVGAKKKYALIDKKGVIKIRGFELVRRDWSKIARDTQKRVLEILLREGDVDKACNLVREKIIELASGKLPLSEVSILAQLRKKADKYDIISPEVSAFNKAKENGLDYSEKTIFAYVITKTGKSISDRAMVVESAKDYDPEYYLNHQLLPAVMKILGELGIKEDDLITNSKQKGLGDW